MTADAPGCERFDFELDFERVPVGYVVVLGGQRSAPKPGKRLQVFRCVTRLSALGYQRFGLLEVAAVYGLPDITDQRKGNKQNRRHPSLAR